MDLVLMIAIFIAGLILIVKGGGYFVDAASWIAGVSGIPKVIVGATIVSVATTMPEMIVSVMAAGQGKTDMSVGNAVGSVTANLGLIMAIAILCMPGPIRRRDYFVKSILMLAAAAVIAAAGRRGAVERGLSLLLLAVFGAFLVENVRSAAAAGGRGRSNRASPEQWAVLLIGVIFVVGAAGVVLGADLLVDSGSALARLAGVSERMIGVTIVAVGTSLPELVTTAAAVVKKQSALSVGNILGANIIDLTLILPLSGLLAGQAMPISAAAGRLDLPACLLVGAAAVLPPMFTRKVQRWQGAALLSLYAGYLYLTCQI